MDIDYRKWDKTNPKLDDAKPGTWQGWYSRASRWLAGGSRIVAKMLEDLRLEGQPLSPEAEHTFALAHGLSPHKVAHTSQALADAICYSSEEGVCELSRRLGPDRGFELFRAIWSKFEGVGPLVGQTLREKVLTATSRCRSAAALREKL